MWPVTLSGRLPVVALVGHYPANKLIGRESIQNRNKAFHHQTMRPAVISSIRPGFPGLSQSQGQVTHVLLTRSPLIPGASTGSSFDLHVLSTPPAFILSQDQTLRKCITDTTQAPGKTGRPCCTKFETSQKNQPTTRGAADQPIQPIKKQSVSTNLAHY